MIKIIELVYTCRKCFKANPIAFYKNDRYKLSEKVGKEFESVCRHCSSVEKIHVNNVHARLDPLHTIIFFGLGFVFSGIIFYSLVGEYWRENDLIQNKSILVIFIGSCIPLAILAVYSISLKEKIRVFNKYRL